MMKLAYKNLEKINPLKKVIEKYEGGVEEDKVQDMTQQLLTKSKLKGRATSSTEAPQVDRPLPLQPPLFKHARSKVTPPSP
eukprot:CAMPEP_0168617504 /NCGR_PEP_ID=MMETSP0449_2-20121227/5576_1 /TAXON_ID=1082188 /ORGANISM="Strombidium rassoulzadegani, Strain ras09" /LENGTH=80 /DNA_ID=CAMNT_0008658321 /DNA_START=325 /DNA_END=565 /DNA_ORIENTATION=-